MSTLGLVCVLVAQAAVAGLLLLAAMHDVRTEYERGAPT